MDENKTTMPSIRVGKKDVLKIEVNDAGEYIELNFADRSFINKYWELGKKVEAYGKFLSESTLPADADDEAKKEFIEKDFEYNKKIAEQIDKLFGAGTCRKVFDTDVPSIDLVAEFITALTPFVQKEVDKRKAGINSRYSPKRKGGAR